MDVVRETWLALTEPLEGGVSCLYADIRGIPTIAYGNAVFTPSEAAGLDLVRPDGTPASTAEKVALWNQISNDKTAPRAGWTYSAKLSPLRLTRAGMTALALAKYDTNDRILRARCPDWDELPACARMALHSLAWACGANAHFPRLFTAVNARDFARTEMRMVDGVPTEVVVGGAALEIHMNERTPEGLHNAGLVLRNVANKLLMRNAARVQAYKLDPQLIEWRVLLGVDDAPTLPELPVVNTDFPPPDNAASSPTEYPDGEHPDAVWPIGWTKG